MTRNRKAPIDIRSAMDEALNVQIASVERPTMIKGVTETWLEATYRGTHIGWIPADTDPNTAMLTARRWLQQNRQIRNEPRTVAMPSAARVVADRLAEGVA